MCRFHEAQEGYDRGDAEAELVCALPASLSMVETGWPSNELLAACGGEIALAPTNARVVRIAGRMFGEGNVLENVVARMRSARQH